MLSVLGESDHSVNTVSQHWALNFLKGTETHGDKRSTRRLGTCFHITGTNKEVLLAEEMLGGRERCVKACWV